MGKKIKKTVKNFSKKDWVSIVTATPPLNPMRLLDKIGEATSDELPKPDEPPSLTPPVEEQRKRVRRSGRSATLLTRPSSLSPAPNIRPTLLGQ